MTQPVALVTGAGRRVGAAIAKLLHRRGFRVILHANRSLREAEKLARRLERDRPDSASPLPADLRQTDPEKLVAEALSKWRRLDLLVNNAALFYPTPLGGMTEEAWEALMTVNAKTPLLLAQAAYSYLAETEGAIVNLLDIYPFRPKRGYTVYIASKAALWGITRALALEMAPKVRVCGVALGAVFWPEDGISEEERREILRETALGRLVAAEDVARAVHFLYENRSMTGEVVVVDGGRLL